jgi:hypothetical protein
MHDIDNNLVGYVLDLLDEDARREVDDYLASSPAGRRKLDRVRQALEPLDAARDEIEPPAGLVAGTLARIAAHSERTLPVAPRVAPGQAAPRSWWRRSETVAACLLGLVSLGLGIAWIGTARQRADVVACQRNLRKFHEGLMQFAEQRDSNALPRVEADGPRAFAGVFLPMLSDAGVLPADASTLCPADGKRLPSQEPGRMSQLEEWYRNDRAKYDQAVAELNGCYAYSLGYREGDGLRGLKRGPGMDEVAIMADCPPFGGRSRGGDGNSRSHGGTGQNVLLMSGAVVYKTTRQITEGDDMYLNEHSLILAGVHEGDTVLAASDAAP